MPKRLPACWAAKDLGGGCHNLVCCNIQFLAMVTGHCLFVGVRLAVPSSFASRNRAMRVRQAVPLQLGRQSRWPIVKGYATLVYSRNLHSYCAVEGGTDG